MGKNSVDIESFSYFLPTKKCLLKLDYYANDLT